MYDISTIPEIDDIIRHPDYKIAHSTSNEYTLYNIIKFNRRPYNFVLAAVAKRGYLLKYARSNHRSDPEIVTAAVMNLPHSFEYASDLLRMDGSFVLHLMKELNIDIFSYADPLIRRNREIIMTALQMDGRNLKYASNEDRANKTIVLTAVKNCGLAYIYASYELKTDKQVIMTAIHNDPDVYNHIPGLEWPEDMHIYRWALYVGEYYVRCYREKSHQVYGYLKDGNASSNYFNFLKHGNEIKFDLKSLEFDLEIKYCING